MNGPRIKVVIKVYVEDKDNARSNTVSVWGGLGQYFKNIEIE